ncbi:MAG: WD40 repeat domain-containing protein [Bdellovibrionales bacterium]|nr:WD40 repeat domain-containing protein [Bdellovibrionales bacterium]
MILRITLLLISIGLSAQAMTLDVAELLGHNNEVHSVSFSKNGKYLASGSSDTSVIVWSTEDKKELFKIHDHQRTVYSVAFSKLNNNILATSSSDGHLILWDINTKQKLKTLVKGNNTSNGIMSLDFSPTNHLLAVSYMGGELALWDTQKGELVDVVKAHMGGFVLTVKFSHNGKRILTTGGIDNDIRVFNTSDLSLREVFHDRNSNSTVWDASFSPVNNDIVSVNSYGNLELWREGKSNIIKRVSINNYLAQSVEYSADGSKIYAGVDAFNSEKENYLKIIDAKSLKIIDKIDLHKNRIRGMDISKDGKHLATASWDESVKLINL